MCLGRQESPGRCALAGRRFVQQTSALSALSWPLTRKVTGAQAGLADKVLPSDAFILGLPAISRVVQVHDIGSAYQAR